MPQNDFERGLAMGSNAVCRVILGFLADSKIPLSTRVERIKNYCTKVVKDNSRK